MQLPIDWSQFSLPIKEKYIDSETPELSCWMVFGRFDDGTVAVCNANGDDVFTHLEPRKAELIVKQRNEWVRQLLTALNSL